MCSMCLNKYLCVKFCNKKKGASTAKTLLAAFYNGHLISYENYCKT